MLGLTTFQTKMVMAVIITMAVSFFAVRWIYFKILKIAKSKNIVDNPNARKFQKDPIPVMGGIAVFFGVMVGVMVSVALPFTFRELNDTLPLVCGMVIMMYVGAIDDILGLSSRSRLIIESLTIICLIAGTGCCIDTFRGLWGIYHFSWWIGIPLTVVTGVGLINSVNMIDGVNGLSSGLCMLCATMFGMLFLKSGDMPNALVAFAMAGALLPFFVHNVFGLHSRMFIGDAGTMVMGLLMAWFVMCILRDDNRLTYYSGAKGVNLIALVLAIMSLAVADTLRVMISRIVRGRSLFAPDKTHLHHVFVMIGISHTVTTIVELLIECAVVTIWAISVKQRAPYDWQLYIVIISALALVWGTYFFLRYHALHHTRLLHQMTHFSIATHMGRTNWWKRITAWLDSPEWESDEEEEQARVAYMKAKYGAKSPYERDKALMLHFMKERAEVIVSDMRLYSGASAEHFDSIIQEGIEREAVRIIKRDANGNPEILALTDR